MDSSGSHAALFAPALVVVFGSSFISDCKPVPGARLSLFFRDLMDNMHGYDIIRVSCGIKFTCYNRQKSLFCRNVRNMTFQCGNRVLVTYQGRTVRACVFTASDNRLSLMLLLDSRVGMYEILMPVIWLDEGYVDLLNAQEVNMQLLA